MTPEDCNLLMAICRRGLASFAQEASIADLERAVAALRKFDDQARASFTAAPPPKESDRAEG